MTRSRLHFVIPTLVLAMVMLPVSAQRPAPVPPATVATATEVEGAGWFTALACAGCLAVGIGIVLGGPASIAAAAHFPGGVVAAGICVGSCVDAVNDAFGS